MNRVFHQELREMIKDAGFRSMRKFYQANTFSFSYEYLRQICSGEKVPRDRKVKELASALSVDQDKLLKKASDRRLSQKIRHHYRLPQEGNLSHLAEKIRRFRLDAGIDGKILRTLEQFDNKAKEQLLQYMRFLMKQCRKAED